MKPVFVCVRALLLIALAGWGVVDDFLPASQNALGPTAENDVYCAPAPAPAPAPENTVSVKGRATDFRSLDCRVRPVDPAPPSSATQRIAANGAIRGSCCGADRLYALMSLQR